MASLVRRRMNTCAFFVFDLLSGIIDAPNLISQVTINNPTRPIRTVSTIHFLDIQRHRTNYGYHEPINNMCIVFNGVSHTYVDGMSRELLRSRVRNASVSVNLNGVMRVT